MKQTVLHKNQSIRLTCDQLGADLEGVCRDEGFLVFVPGVLPGEVFDAKIVKAHASYSFAKIESLLSQSPHRRDPFCENYVLCGGCSGQHMTYSLTLEAKRQQVFDNLTRIGGLDLNMDDVPPVLGADRPTQCRNKASLPVGGTPAKPLLGFYRRRSHDIVNIADCPISMQSLAGVITSVKQWIQHNAIDPYHEVTHSGLLRHVVVRSNRSGDMMILLVTTSYTLPGTDHLIALLKQHVAGFHSLHISKNASRGNVILGKESKVLYGADSLMETLLGLSFAIDPLAFFQVNPEQTEVLYKHAIRMADLHPDDIVVDAYAGAGTIALCMAGHCKHVIGLEIVPQAVESAVRNAKLNGIQNAEFQTAAVEERLPQLIAEGLTPDVVVLDPPRKGVAQPVIDALLQAKPRRIVYVSCHVPSQARDIKKLTESGYRFIACQPVDMFCYAGGVENVLCLER